MAKPFRVPLSKEALAVIDQAKPFERNGLLFSNTRGTAPISDMTLSRMMERRGLEARPHGFRSSLRDWLAEATDTSRDIAETILAHKAGGEVELAYKRTDFLEQRHTVMERWSQHCLGQSGQVVRLAR